MKISKLNPNVDAKKPRGTTLGVFFVHEAEWFDASKFEVMCAALRLSLQALKEGVVVQKLGKTVLLRLVRGGEAAK